ncbi:MAG: hypothetical protein AVDCRST_MAG85-3103 [uncultured Solirubrobacteraceae bacterium]|uniref:Uncharacterized protein n=1 Tax=uncultured Solirubrobacteraceae bacterium TaxID=1162706 RepID=A0A6J4TJX5_9ACTN|nr:MAG: hypothetical protein AVDCRST_MAG85-3103 [uncultured Solirubrobacteraceae bacterium]
MKGLPAAAFACALAALLTTTAASAAPLNRPDDPVVLTGAKVPGLAGAAPQDIVAFRFAAGTGWQQVPVQVDERAMLDLAKPYAGTPTGVVATQYTDAATYTGPDPEATFDADDEVALMAADLGILDDGTEPVGVVPGSGVRVRVTDPLDAAAEGHVTLFRRDGTTLDPGAARTWPVSYTFRLANGGTYPAAYNLANGPNPEDSTVTTPFYQRHFSDRWVDDRLRVFTGGASGVDLLDRHKFQFGPGSCIRSEDTFSNAEGAFVVNKNGPIRAIRSYMGANSGPYTQRTHLFYPRRHDVVTALRVHAINGTMDFYDYTRAAFGMTYRHSADQRGVTIDGKPDTITAGTLEWERVSGATQGSLSIVHQTRTTIPGFTMTSWYLDNLRPGSKSGRQCTGDSEAVGASGPWQSAGIPSTDRTKDGVNDLENTRTIYYEAPGGTTADTVRRAQTARAALVAASG